MNEFILSLIKYTAIFTCTLYAYTKLLRIKPRAWDLFDIPLFAGFSTVLHITKIYIKLIVPIGLLVFIVIFLFLRFRKTFYETVTVGTIALGISLSAYAYGIILSFPIAAALYSIKNELVKNIIEQLSISSVQIVSFCLLFKIKRLQSGINPKGESATFEILLFFSVACIFTMMLLYTKNATNSLYEIITLIVAFCGLLLIIWWRRHITYSYREAVNDDNFKRMEDKIGENDLNSVEKDLQLAAYSKASHYLNKALPECLTLAERAAEQTGNADICAVRDMLKNALRELNIANEKCSLKNIPQTGERFIDAPIINMFAAAERKKLNVSADISEDVTNWFKGGKPSKDDIKTLLTYLCDNAVISALGLPDAKVRAELGATVKGEPLIRIFDSGKQFDEEVLSKLGLEQITTRAGVGGKGIGLFTVFEILAKYGASFMLDEAPQSSEFSKFIEIAFDGEHSITVRTCRESVSEACAKRKDITVELLTTEVLRDGTNG